MNYHHLTIEERSRIRKYYVDGLSYREIARLIRRNVSTVSREIRRNCTHKHGVYDVDEEARLLQHHRHRPPIHSCVLHHHADFSIHGSEPTTSPAIPAVVCCTSNGPMTNLPPGRRTATMLLYLETSIPTAVIILCSIGIPPTKDLQPATAPAHYRFSLLSYPNVRKTLMIQPAQIERRNERAGLQFAIPSAKAHAGHSKADYPLIVA